MWLGGGEQDNRVFESLQGVPRLWYDQEVTLASLSVGVAGAQPHATAEHDDGRLPRAVVLGQGGPFPEGDHRLPQDPFVAAEESGRTSTA